MIEVEISEGKILEIRLPVLFIFQKDRNASTYHRGFYVFFSLLQQHNVVIEEACLCTDDEPGMFNPFITCMQKFFGIKIKHLMCKTHYNRCVSNRLSVLGLTQLRQESKNFELFINRCNVLIYLPPIIIPEYLKFIIAIVIRDGHNYEVLFEYFLRKFNVNYSESASFYFKILGCKKSFMHLTNNMAESYNCSLNRFIMTVSKSKNLNTILTRLRVHYCVMLREAEIQYSNKTSYYAPSVTAINRFQNARKFVNKLALMDQTKINQCFLKKLNALVDQFYDKE